VRGRCEISLSVSLFSKYFFFQYCGNQCGNQSLFSRLLFFQPNLSDSRAAFGITLGWINRLNDQ
jgi:hypothetical protein